ncbi:BRCT domain-containing protein [Obelidium mucronatum]|nr:BRCT domain-containing protein [Obelidium mucronatum]
MPLVITATGLEQEDRLQITKVAGTIGAVFSPSLTSSTTHLIANGPGSEKYKVASQRGIPIVHPSWINACLTISSKRKIAALSIDDVAEITKQHAVKALSNLRICVTGFDLEQRNRIEGLVKSLGAMFDSDLTRECTHLVALSTTSKKYEFAIKNGIKVVGAAWIDKCVLTNDRVSEEAFPVESMPAIREAPKIRTHIRQHRSTPLYIYCAKVEQAIESSRFWKVDTKTKYSCDAKTGIHPEMH